MLTDQESTDELLAKWAELLRARKGLQDAGGCEHFVRYWPSLGEEPREYAACSADFDIINDLHAMFYRDIDDCIAKIEAALKKRGVSVQRPPLEAPVRKAKV